MERFSLSENARSSSSSDFITEGRSNVRAVFTASAGRKGYGENIRGKNIEKVLRTDRVVACARGVRIDDGASEHKIHLAARIVKPVVGGFTAVKREKNGVFFMP